MNGMPVLRRMRQMESQLEDANRRAMDAVARAESSEMQSRQCESALASLRAWMSRIDVQRGNLAISLDTSLRQLGSAQKALRGQERVISRMRWAPPMDEHPGLMQELTLLQLKLYGTTAVGDLRG